MNQRTERGKIRALYDMMLWNQSMTQRDATSELHDYWKRPQCGFSEQANG